MMGLSGAFSSLGINENAPSSKKNSKNRSTISLPNIIFSDKPVPKFNSDDSEKPIDFSKKYGEDKTRRNCTFNKVVKSYNNSFTMYAETDLDQPTDYSLRYAEDDSDSDRCNKKTETTEFVQDTIKTYCTEDTPYETPFNFSTSTSMSDLRITENKDEPKDVTVIVKEPPTKNKGFSSGLMSPEKPVNYCEEGTPGYFSRVASCGSLNSFPDPPKPPESIKKEPRKLTKLSTEVKAVKFEEVVNYAEETPLMFSRSSSLESLDSIEQHSIHDDRSSVVSDFSRLTSGIVSPSELPDSPSQTVPPSPKPAIVFPKISRKSTDETKTGDDVPKCSVFEDVVKKFKVESTPLEFSTATSLSSLIDEVDSKEKNKEIKTEKNLELSESSEDEDILAACINIGMQSNRYSQAKAPSPPPTHHSPTFKFPNLINTRFKKNSTVLPLHTDTDLPKNDVTSDSLRTYCTEGTPALLSHAGSNSNLSVLSLNEKVTIKDTIEDEKRALLEPNISEDGTGHEAPPEKPEVDCSNQSRRSSFSSLSDDSHESEEALLEECMLAGMPKGNNEESRMKISEENLNEELSDDLNILEDCIKMGIENNRFVQPKLPPKDSISNKISNDVINDTVKSYCTEDTPAILSHAGSCSNLSILSLQGTENGISNYLSDVNSNFSDEDEEKLLEDCLKYGMAAISEKVKEENKKETVMTKKVNGKSVVETASSSSSISLSDDSYDSDQDLLQQCIQAGMPKKQEESGDLTAAEKALLQQCILEGMKKCRTTPTLRKNQEEDSSELTEAEQALLRQCILSGMPKNKNLAQGGPSRHRESTELTESERLLLQQCILAGMPKNRSKNSSKKKDRGSSEHTCCVHCPRVNKSRQSGYVRGRRKYKDRATLQYRESRDVNIVYVTSQILTIKNEVVERTHENWV